MVNSLRLLGRVERLFVSGLRKNIVALLVQCAVVGGVTLQGAQISDAVCPSQVINLAYCNLANFIYLLSGVGYLHPFDLTKRKDTTLDLTDHPRPPL